MTANLQTARDVVAGVVSGGAPVVLFYPVDLLRTQVQVQHLLLGAEQRLSVAQLAGRIWAESGVRGFYRGLPTNLVGSCLAWGAYFSVFHRLQRGVSASAASGHRASVSAAANLACGFAAGLVSAALTTPIWIVKTRIQVGGLQGTAAQYRGLVHGLGTIWRSEGVVGLTRGLVPGLLATSHTALQFTVYEELIKHADAADSRQVMLCGAVSKVAASTLTNPLFVLKSRMQIHSPERQTADMTPFSRSLRLAAKDAYRHEGLAGFYRGWLLSLLRTVPSSSLSFVVFEAVASAIREK